MSLVLSPQERQYYDTLFGIVDKDKSGLLPGQDALPFLMSSGLSQQILGEVWAVADPENNGFLTPEGWYKAARLIGWMQKGNQTVVDEGLAFKSGPLPTFQGQAPPPQPLAAQTTGRNLPTLTPADRTKFTRIFVGCGPHNGVITGEKARDVFVKSKLGYEKLAQIWNLADTQQRGSLDLPDFIIGMYLIQSCMADPLLQLPATLPPGIYEQASGGRPPPTSPISRQNTGVSTPSRQNTASPGRPQHTGLQSQLTGQAAFHVPTSQAAFPAAWDVTAEAKAASDRFFTQLDTANKGVIDGDVAVPFMLQSQLEEGVLAAIWDLADIRHEGKLDRDEFAVAMYLINGKLAGRDVPKTLPASLVPPSLRGIAGSQEVLAPPGQSSAARDLFDLDFDEPTPAAPSATILPQTKPVSQPAFTPQPSFSPQPPATRAISPPPPDRYAAFSIVEKPANDLLDDESASVPDNSAEVGNKQNELNNTQRGLEELTKTRSELEKSTASSAAQLEELQSKLSEARVKHEAESKAVADLRVRVEEQSARSKQLNADFISAESDLSAMRSEKDELEQALLADKEEVRGLQKRIKEVDEEKATLKTLLEKLRKEARQQKGMVTITKKQLSTAEASRDAVKQDIADAENTTEAEPLPSSDAPFSPATLSTAASIALPSTPQALSPAPTGASQRSKNPFSMLRSPQPTESSSGPVALAGAAAGAVMAGAETLYNAAKDVVAPLSPDPVPVERTDEDKDSSAVDPFGITTNEAHGDSNLAATAPSDFDSAFADFDPPGSTVEPSSVSVEDTSFGDAPPPSLSIPAGIPKSALTAEMRPDHERTVSTQAMPPSSRPETPQAIDEPVEMASSDEDDGPEDLEAPRPLSEAAPPVLSAPIGEAEQKSRRSAPPPPNKPVNVADLDPFGVPEPSVKVTPKTGGFDDDEFDFSDLPPAQVDATSQAAVSFDDGFAGFDDDFDRPTGSENSGKSYEMVSPVQSASTHPVSVPPTQPVSVPPTQPHETSRHYDEWGLGGTAHRKPAPPALSFDDAFGGEFDPAPPTQVSQESTQEYAPPSGPPPSNLAPPSMPQRRESQSQPDDLEDVKKLCNMGFPRTLVIDALEANDYDFQKTLNVLLQ